MSPINPSLVVKPRLLIVNRYITALDSISLLAERYFSVDLAENGLDALATVKAHPRHHFDAILLSQDIPIMSAVECLAKIKKHFERSDLERVLSRAKQGHTSSDEECSSSS